MNPFIQNFRLKVIALEQDMILTSANSSTGEVRSSKQVKEITYVEQQEHTNLYNIPYIENILFTELKANGRDLLLYLIYNIKRNEDFITLKQSKVSKEMDIGRSTFYNAILQLIDVGIICKKVDNIYWVNPFYVFKGDRYSHYQKQYADCIDVVSRVKK